MKLRNWLRKVGASLRRLLERLLRIVVAKPRRSPAEASSAQGPAPELGQWHHGTAGALLGSIDLTPLAPPARDYQLYQPPMTDPNGRLMVMLHGCRQDANDIAIGTRLNEHADERGWPVLYPQQMKTANRWNCWNWFDPANVRGHGEAAIIIAMLDEVQQRYAIAGAPAFLAGMSAGGALASILALRYPQRWAAVAIHSGLPYAAAEDPFTALRVMKEGAESLVAAKTLRARSPDAPGVPAIILHGSDDNVVDRRNAELLVRQFLGWNGHLGDEAWETATLPAVEAEHVDTVYNHPYVSRRYERKGLAPVHECEVIGMGHAWAGGDPSLPYHDERGPDASALMVEFFAGVAGVKGW